MGSHMDYTFLEGISTSFEKRFEVSLEAEEAEKRVENIYAFLAIQAGIDYIANQPKEDLEGRFGGDVAERVAVCLANQCADEIISDLGLPAALEPVVEVKSEIGGRKPFTCQIVVYVKPELDLSSYEPLSLPIPEFGVSDDMVEKNVRALVEDRARYVEDPDAVEVGSESRVEISLRTDKCGMEVQPLTFDKIVYQVGSGLLPDQIDEHLIGMKAGESRAFSFAVTSKNFLGLDVEEVMNSKLVVFSIVKKETPEITDAWVKDNIPGAHDAASFYALMRENVEHKARVDYDRLKDEAASSALASRLPDFQVPEIYYDYVRAGLLQNVSAALSRQGMSQEELFVAQGVDSNQFLLQMSARARDVLRQGFALDAWARHWGIEADRTDLLQAAAKISQKDPEGAYRMLQMNGRLYQLREMTLRSKARSDISAKALICG